MKTAVRLVNLFLILALSSCSNAPTSVEMDSSTAIIGKVGSERNYVMTEKWFVPGTDSPYVAVPAVLLGHLGISDSAYYQGAVQVTNVTETVYSLDSSYYASWHLPPPRSAYVETRGYGTRYDLNDNILALENGLSYSPGYGMVEGDDPWYETRGALYEALANDYKETPYLLKPFVIGRSWLRDEAQYYDSTAHRTMSDNIMARVVDEEVVTVNAGTFEAYKVEISANWPGLNYSVITGYEYYVPGIGLILYKSDAVVNSVTLYPNGENSGTITYRRVITKELQSYTIAE